MKWKGKLINSIVKQLKEDSKWSKTIEKFLIDPTVGFHLAVCNEPFMSLILNCEKKFESRFSINKISPYLKVAKGDIVILKISGGLVTGAFVAGEVKFFHIDNKDTLHEIETLYGQLICSSYDALFWDKRQKSKYATLIEVKKVIKLQPFKTHKKDRTAWTILREGFSNSLFNKTNEN